LYSPNESAKSNSCKKYTISKLNLITNRYDVILRVIYTLLIIVLITMATNLMNGHNELKIVYISILYTQSIKT